MKIVPGTCDAARRESGVWMFVDIGFSRDTTSSCIAIDESEPSDVLYGELGPWIANEVNKDSSPLNLLTEAPLSVAFNVKGCPTGRTIEKRRSATRYWYQGAGAATLLAATHLLRSLNDMSCVQGLRSDREIRLFEGFASFKPKGKRASHAADVAKLRRVAWGETNEGRIVSPQELKVCNGDILRSAFIASGMDFGIPPVVEVY